MADDKQFISNLIQFISSHWGEMYTAIDIAGNIFKSMGGGEDVPDTIDPKLKGVMGLFGLKDERDFLLKLRALKSRLPPSAFKRIMLYFAWEIEQAKKLEDRLTYRGSRVVLVLYLNRLRTLFAGIPDSPGTETGTMKSMVREGKRTDDRVISTTTTTKTFETGSQPGVDVLVMLSEEIERHWRSISKKYQDEPTASKERLEEAFELTRDTFRVAGLPRMPRADEVPDLKKLYSWIMEHGGPVAKQIAAAAKAAGAEVWTEIKTAPQQIKEAHKRLHERNRQRNPLMRGLHWLLS